MEQPTMTDKEFYERAEILIHDMTQYIKQFPVQDYENLNLVSIELHKRKMAAGGRPAQELGPRYQPE